MTWVAVAVGGASLVGAGLSYAGSKDAASKAAQGSDAAIAEQRRQFDTIRADTANYRGIGNQALNALGSIYGYQPAAVNPIAGATPFQAQPMTDGGFFNTGAGAVLNPWTVTSKLGGVGKILDPAGGLLGNLFGNKHGDEKRNLKAFTSENQIYDLGNGMLALADGTQFPKNKLQDVAGAWYGATYAPDGDQTGWQQRYGALIQKPQANIGQAGTGLTSDGVKQGVGLGPAQTQPLTAPDYSKFFQSPDYQFRRDEGTRDINNSFAARGGALSGNALRALTEYNSNLAAGEFGNYFNRQAALAGIGQTATNTAAQAGLTTGANVGNALMNAGNARASGIAGGYNAIGAGISSIGNSLGDYLQTRQNPYGYDSSGIGYFTPTVRRR